MKKTEIRKIISALNTLCKELLYTDEKEDEVIPEKERKGFMDSANCFMIVPKTKLVYETMLNLIDLETYKPEPAPQLDFKAEDGEEIKSKYSTFYLQIMLKMCEFYDSVTIKMKRDYLICFETEDFQLLLAPRVSDEED